MPVQKQNPELQPEESGATIERRFFKTEARASKDETGKMVIGGYGAVFNQYTNMGWYAEVVLPGFFDGIKDDRAACLFNHDANQVLGRKKNSTLTLKVDEKGLDYQAVLPSHRADVYELVQDGYIYESSFAFTTMKSTWSEVDRSLLVDKMSAADLDQLSYGGKVTVRQLEKGKELFDASPVTYGAYEGTSTDTRIAKRSFDAWKSEQKPEEKSQTEAPAPPEKSRRMRFVEAIARNKQFV